MDLGRREFLKLGIAGTVTLSAASLGATLAGCGRREEAAAQGYRFLRDADLKLLAAVAPVVLAGLPMEAGTVSDILRGIDNGFARVGPPTQANLRKLFDLLNFGLTRWITTGVREPWDQASAEQVDAFLQRWRKSSVGLFTTGYSVLVRLTSLVYFSLPIGEQVAGYRPLPRVYDVVNA